MWMERNANPKNKTMETNDSTESTNNRMSFIDYGDWHIGKECMTVLIDRPDGRQVVVGRINFDYDSNAKKPMYRSYDANGKEIYGASYNLALVKKQYKRHEQAYVAHVEHQERRQRVGDPIEKLSDEFGGAGAVIPKTPRTPKPSPYAKELGKKGNTLKKIREEKINTRKEKTLTR